MTWAHKRKWIATNPCDIERGTSYRAVEPEAPSYKQVEIMLDCAPEPYKAVLAIAAWGGLRKGEIFELRRKDIEKVTNGDSTYVALNIRRAVIWDGSNAIVKVPKTAKSYRRVILPEMASAVVESHLKCVRLSPDSLLFTGRSELNEHWGEYKLKQVWRKVCAQAGFKGRFHSLRAFALTQYAVTGATIQDLMDRAGHSNVEMAMRYQRGTGRELDLISRM
jgi:integrase